LFRKGLRIEENPARDLAVFPEDQSQHKPPLPQVAAPGSYLSFSQRLYDVLIRPIKDKCLAADHLCFIPHGPLHFMPFHALHDGRQYLIEQKPVSYAPSATTLRESLAEEFVPIKKVLALGDPQSQMRRLDAARREVETIELRLGEQRCLQATGTRATRDLVMKAGSGSDADYSFDCWHLAMHGIFVHSAPHLSYFQMASNEETDGRVYAFEIASMQRVGRLSVLSACQTAMTREGSGDELSGLLFSFMAAGAQSVIASLWSVEDEATAKLMECFYSHLDNLDRMSLATALRKAQLAVLATPETNSPFFWAPFVLHGNWNPVPEPNTGTRPELQPGPSPRISEGRARIQERSATGDDAKNT
jgi:CHAT domain-containing protein